MEIWADIYVSIQDQVAEFINDFDLDFAIGVQLDKVGLWIGQSRFINEPIRGVYFTWGTRVDEGWGNSIWKPLDAPAFNIVELNDDDYRALLKSKILSNNWDGSIEQAYAILQTAFVAVPPITITDNQNMTMTVTIDSSGLTDTQVALVTEGYVIITPTGVKAIFNVI